jgi:gliding motility-associated-like protein
LVSPDVFLNAYSNIDSICPGDPVLMTAEPSGGNNHYTIILENDTVNYTSVLYPNLTYDYTFTVIDGCGETATAIVPIFVYPIPPASFYPDIMKGCQPLTVSFIETSPDSGQTFLWNFGDGDPSNIGTNKNPIHVYQNAGDFDVSLTVTSADGCLNTIEIFNLIHVYPIPEAKFIADPDVVSIIEPEVYFNNESIGGDSYSWDFGDSDTSSIENPTHIYPTNAITDYIVTLIVTTNRGCVDTVKKTLRVREEFTFYAPSAFSPDGDGINDFFICKGNGIDLDNYYLAIYDRWGEIIWETNDLYDAWDGIAKTHKKVQNGLYKWHVIYKNSDGVEYKKTGNVTVIY